MRPWLAALLLCLNSSVSAQSSFWYPDDLRFSAEAEIGCYPCLDTLKVYGFKHVVDLRPMLPSWRPVVDHDTVVVLEGQVMPIEGHLGYEYGIPHVSFEDLPLYHYTHDFSFNLFPDSAYRNLLSRYIRIETDSSGKEIRDTIVRDWVHCEWESGLGAGNRGNKYSKVCRKGGTAGFATAGHERGDIIWNWPTANDWVHVEGLWIWDRGHPPAKTEIHPMRFMATRRNLPDKILTPKGDSVFATRIDLFGNGDGSAFYNNQDTSKWVRNVRMSSKDYNFNLLHTLPRPTRESELKYLIVDRKGNTFHSSISVEFVSPESSTVTVNIPWKTASLADNLILAKTLYLYWDEGLGVPKDYRVHSYTVNLEKLWIRRLSEVFFLTPAELRMFADVGGQYIFLNEQISNSQDILRHGFGKTIRKRWKINKSTTIYVPEGRSFRVYVGGWEADGVDKVMGHIIDQYSECASGVKSRINDLMLDPTPVGYGGCEDDNMGESIRFHSPENLLENGSYRSIGNGKPYKENCPLGNRTPVNFHQLEYSIMEN
jgi:hypothetical protein